MDSSKDKLINALTKVIAVFAIFSIGFFSALALNLSLSNSFEHPLSFFSTSELRAPSDFIKEDNIKVYENKIVIELDDASLSKYSPTGSMLPIFDKGANGIRVIPKSKNDISVGDIVTFEKDSILIVHRVVEKGQDENGTYFITQGDNNQVSDGKIRFSDIKYLTVGILY